MNESAAVVLAGVTRLYLLLARVDHLLLDVGTAWDPRDEIQLGRFSAIVSRDLHPRRRKGRRKEEKKRGHCNTTLVGIAESRNRGKQTKRHRQSLVEKLTHLMFVDNVAAVVLGDFVEKRIEGLHLTRPLLQNVKNERLRCRLIDLEEDEPVLSPLFKVVERLERGITDTKDLGHGEKLRKKTRIDNWGRKERAGWLGGEDGSKRDNRIPKSHRPTAKKANERKKNDKQARWCERPLTHETPPPPTTHPKHDSNVCSGGDSFSSELKALETHRARESCHSPHSQASARERCGSCDEKILFSCVRAL